MAFLAGFSRRTLPHWQFPGRDLFLTGRLAGTLPRLPVLPVNLSPGERFAFVDRALDRERSVRWLERTELAQIVRDEILRLAPARLYDLHADVVMPNHVHILITPLVPLARISNTVKGVTARRANQLLDRVGQPFWQRETYDHWVRDRREWGSIRRYIEFNPVKAGLVTLSENWPWSSAAKTPPRSPSP